jgi:hypothetical protein
MSLSLDGADAPPLSDARSRSSNLAEFSGKPGDAQGAGEAHKP